MWKIENSGKSLKSGKFRIILKNIFYHGEKWKILEKYAGIWGTLKSGTKCEKLKNFVKVWKVKNLKLFRKIFFTAVKWRVENTWKICWNLGKVEKSDKKCEK